MARNGVGMMQGERRGRLTVTMVGERTDDDALRFADFIQQLDSVRKALKETCRIRLPDAAKEVEFRVTELSRSSPTTVVLEMDGQPGADDMGEAAFAAFVDDGAQIERGERPRGYDGKALSAFQEMGSRLGKRVPRMDISANGRTVPFSARLHHSVGALLGPKQYAYGSITGKLEHINIHRRQNIFTVYPIAGKTDGVRCHFGKALLEDAAGAVNRYVEVVGKLTYNTIDPHPEEISCTSIHVYPEVDVPPRLADLQGIAPDATGKLSSEEFVRELRDEA